MKRSILLIIVVILCAGCTVQQKARDLTDRICDMDPIKREALRSVFDAATYPNKIRVECGGN